MKSVNDQAIFQYKQFSTTVSCDYLLELVWLISEKHTPVAYRKLPAGGTDFEIKIAKNTETSLRKATRLDLEL